MDSVKEIAARLLKSIEDSDFSYGTLSDATGLSKATIQRYATGQTKKIPVDRLEQIARAMNISSAYLMGWEESPIPMEKEKSPPSEEGGPVDNREEFTQMLPQLSPEGKDKVAEYIRLLAKGGYTE